MIKLCDDRCEIEEIILYIGKEYKKTPYFYVNVVKYGIKNENVKVWIDREEEILGAYLLYYDCLHFYTRNMESYDCEKILAMINKINPKVIMVQGGFGQRIESMLSSDFDVEKNYVIDMDGVNYEDKEYKSELALEKDVEAIADLLLTDSEYVDVYNRGVLIQQLRDRYNDGFGRMVVVRQDNKIVATCSTYGEVAGFALVGGVMVHKDYRRRGLAADVENYICSILAKDNISSVGFVNYNNTPSLNLHEKLGAVKISNLYKFVRKNDWNNIEVI